MVLALVLLPALAGLLDGSAGAAAESFSASDVVLALAITFGKVAAFLLLMLVVGRRVIPWILHYVAHTGSRELFRLAVLAIGLGIAYGAAQIFDVSFALGAFFAGMVLSESELSHRAAEESLPLRDAFAVLFFVAVGILFDPLILVQEPLPVLAVLAIILIGKSVAAFAIVIAFRHPVGTALMIAASLAQIGEFSFILANLGVDLGLLPERGRDLILAGAILSILANPAIFAAIGRFKIAAALAPAVGAPEGEPAVVARISPTALTGHAVIIGYGRVGGRLGETLRSKGHTVLAIEDNGDIAARLRGGGVEVIAGNAAAPEILNAANLPQARWCFVAVPNAFEAGQIIEQARAINPQLPIIARAHFDAEVEHLQRLGASVTIMGENEIARAMAEHAV